MANDRAFSGQSGSVLGNRSLGIGHWESVILHPLETMAVGALLMDVRRRFLAALAVFALWVAALGVLAVLSGREPPRRPAAAEKADR